MPNKKLTVYGTISPPSYAEDILEGDAEALAKGIDIEKINTAIFKENFQDNGRLRTINSLEADHFFIMDN